LVQIANFEQFDNFNLFKMLLLTYFLYLQSVYAQSDDYIAEALTLVDKAEPCPICHPCPTGMTGTDEVDDNDCPTCKCRLCTCVDDPEGIVAVDPTKDCANVNTGLPGWDCEYYDSDFNGHDVYIYELCPKTCGHCDTFDCYATEACHSKCEREPATCHEYMSMVGPGGCAETCCASILSDVESALCDCVPNWDGTKASCTNECRYVDMIIERAEEGDGKPCPEYYNCQENDGECHKTEKVCEEDWFGKNHVCADVGKPSEGHGYTGIQKIRGYVIPFIAGPGDKADKKMIEQKIKQDECRAWCQDQYGAGCCELRLDDCMWKPNSVMRYSVDHELSTALECVFTDDLKDGFHDYEGDVKFHGACADMYGDPLPLGDKYELMDTVEGCEARCEESEACESYSYVKVSATILVGTEEHELPKDACQLYTQMGIRGDNTPGVTCYIPKYSWDPEDYNLNKYMKKDVTCECSDDEECISHQLGQVVGNAQKCMYLCRQRDMWDKRWVEGRCCKATAVEGLEDVFECEMLSRDAFFFVQPLRRSLSPMPLVWAIPHQLYWGIRNRTEAMVSGEVGGHGIHISDWSFAGR